MNLECPHEIRDPIHGLIHLTSQELAIVNTPVFQRLRRIRQLAMADLVYPGALHTRFEHSLGVLHIANRILERLNKTEQLSDNDAVAVRLAALLHDIGHGPFSHVSENLLESHSDRNVLPHSIKKEKIHELITLDIIGNDTVLTSLLSSEQQGQVVRLIRGSGSPDFRRDIVSSSLDADKMDYLLRDAHYAGVRYGQYDLDKIVDSFRVKRQGDESYLMIDESGRFAVEQLILSKHHMFQQVYAHRVRTITDAMIIHGLGLAIRAGQTIREIYSYDGSPEHRQRYLNSDDSSLTLAVLQSPDLQARAIFQRLRDRVLYKELALISIDDVEVPNALLRRELLTLSSRKAATLERAISELIGCSQEDVIVYRKSVKNPAYSAPALLEPEAILVLPRNGEPKAWGDFPEMVFAKLPSTEWLQVIGPWDREPAPSSVTYREARRDLEQEIRSLVLEGVVK